jgi:lysyl-tRNA synthetase class 2
MDDCTALLRVAAEAAESPLFVHAGRTAGPFLPPLRLTLAKAFERFAGIDLLATLDGAVPDRDALAAAANRAGIKTAPDDTWSDVLSRILVEKIEPNIGNLLPTFLTEYPASLAASARPSPLDPRVAERFELYACGVELANGFGELADPAEQRRRLEAEMAEKERRYGERYPIDEDFLAALAEMPPASGAALGFDRLVMLATGADHVEQVIWTPVAEIL